MVKKSSYYAVGDNAMPAYTFDRMQLKKNIFVPSGKLTYLFQDRCIKNDDEKLIVLLEYATLRNAATLRKQRIVQKPVMYFIGLCPADIVFATL